MESLELARNAYSHYLIERDDINLKRIIDHLNDCKIVLDLEHVEWLSSILEISELGTELRNHIIRLLYQWIKDMQAVAKDDGIPIVDPLRQELMDAAVLFLEDDKNTNKTAEEKAEFLLEKGLNKTEILISFNQAGTDPPSWLSTGDDIRKSMVENGAAFLRMPTIATKPIEDRLTFLKGKGLNTTEIIMACKQADVSPAPTPEYITGLPSSLYIPIREAMVENAVKFLLDRKVSGKSLEQKLRFLQGKGLTGIEIQKSCEKAKVVIPEELMKIYFEDPGISKIESDETRTTPSAPLESPAPEAVKSKTDEHVRENMVDKGVQFLQHASVRTKPIAEKHRFLKQKGLTDLEIETAERRAGGSSELSGANIEKAVQFLKHPQTAGRSMREKIAFLESKNYSKDDIELAIKRAGITRNDTKSISRNATSANGSDGTKPETMSKPSSLHDEKARHDAVRKAVTFLSKTDSNSVEERILFLLQQGLSEENIKEAFFQSGIHIEPEAIEKAAATSNPSEHLIERAAKFLQSDSIKTLSDAEKARYLLFEKQYARDTAQQAFLRSGYTKNATDSIFSQVISPNEIREDMVGVAVAFLEKIETFQDETARFLEKKGITVAEIQKAVDSLPQLRNRLLQQAQTFLDQSGSESSQHEKVIFLKHKGIPTSVIIEAVFSRLSSEERNAIQHGLKLLNNSQALLHSRESCIDMLQKNDVPNHLEDLILALSATQWSVPKSVTSEHERAIAFLKDPKTRNFRDEDKNKYLQKKGYSLEEITRAQKEVGGSVATQAPLDSRSRLKAQAIKFLQSAEARSESRESKIQFLRRKGLTTQEISQLLQKLSIDQPSSDDLLNRAKTFLLDKAMQSTPIEEKIDYLIGKGLTRIQVENLAKELQIDLTPSFLSSIPMERIRDARHMEPDDMEPNATQLQRIVNSCVSLLVSRMEMDRVDTEIEIFSTSVCGLLAMALCRCRPAGINANCVAYACMITQKVLCMCQLACTPSLSQARDVVFSVIELTARATQMNDYIKAGLHQKRQTNLKFIDPAKVVIGLLCLWVTHGDGIPFDHGMLVSRGFHNEFCRVAVSQLYTAASGPVITALLDNQGEDSMRGLIDGPVSYAVAGILLGGPEFGWAKDVSKSPRPDMESFLHDACYRSISVLERVIAKNASITEEWRNLFRASRGAAVAVGLACVYANKEIDWNLHVFQAVTEGLLNGALWPVNILETSESLDVRASLASQYANDGELFRMVPNLVQSLMFHLPNIAESEHWLIRRLHRHSKDVFKLFQACEDLGNTLAKRTTQWVYPSSTKTVTVDEGGIDTLETYFGIHTGIAKLMQMGYISIVVLGNAIQGLIHHSDAWRLLDCMSDVNAFQVRVQDVLHIESRFKTSLQLDTYSTHVALQVFQASNSSAHVDWTLAAKVEYLMMILEPSIQPIFNEMSVDTVYSSEESVKLNLQNAAGISEIDYQVDIDAVSFASCIVDMLLKISIPHPFEQLNHRGHTWLTGAIGTIVDSKVKMSDTPEVPPLRLSLIVPYFESAIKSHPRATPTVTLSFMVGSVFSSLGRDPSEFASKITKMAFQRLYESILHESSDNNKSALCSLYFTSLKVVPLHSLGHALNNVSRHIRSVSEESKPTESLTELEKPLYSKGWFEQTLFTTIMKTEDRIRRILLSRWYLESIQGYSLQTRL